MADLKTELRELSVVASLYNEINNLNFDLSSYKNFMNVISQTGVCTNKPTVLSSISSFNNDCKNIISNGIQLAKELIKKLNILSIKELSWYGFDTQKDDPYDISVNNYLISLKEESFILENMGLYKLLNCFTGSSYKKRHIFEDYAPNEYADWFSAAWSALLKYLSKNLQWKYTNPKKTSHISKVTMIGNQIVMEYNDGNSVIKEQLPANASLNDFRDKISGKIKEEVFAKFIKNEIDNDANYLSSKVKCAKAATIALANELTKNLNYNAGIARFLRIHDKEYYYAKTTKAGVQILKVPSKSNFQNQIQIVSIVSSVPDSQANILTTIENKITKKKLVLRNECRFSHGQFNGTPEAKMYYENGGDLTVIYQSI